MIQSLIISLFIPLTKIINTEEWEYKLVGAIKDCYLDSSSVVVSFAIELAAIFCIIRLVSIASQIMSDNQMGGYGGIEIQTIIRPLVLFFVIQSFGLWIKTFDTVCSTVSNSLAVETSKVEYSPDKNIIELIANDQRIKNAAGLGKLPEKSDDSNFIFSHIKEAWQNFDIKHYNKSLSHLIGGCLQDVLGLVFNLSMISLEKTQNTSTAIRDLALLIPSFLFEIERIIMNLITAIYLSFLAFIGPMAFAFSILDKWKDSWWNWISAYIEVSLWQVGIQFIVNMTILTHGALEDIYKSGTSFRDQLVNGDLLSVTVLSAFVAIAGYKMLKSVPSLVHMALSLSGQAGGANAGGGTVGGAITGTASTVAKLL